MFLIEGIRHVGEAIQSQFEIEYVLYAPHLLRSEFAKEMIHLQMEMNVPCYELTPEIFSSMADKENPQGLLAVARQRRTSLTDLSPKNFSLGVAVVDPQDPGNLGTILRTIDAVGASGLLLLSNREDTSGMVDPYHPNCVRASMGTLFWLPFAAASFDDFARWSAMHGYFVYGSSAHAAIDYQSISLEKRPCILLLGSEREGLIDSQAEICDSLVRIPMQGKASSLNISVAAGILLYAMIKGKPNNSPR